MKCARPLVPAAVLAMLFLLVQALPTMAAAPLASRDADRQAKSAAPPKDQAFIYAYRREDRTNVSLTVSLNGRDTAQLDSRTFVMWRVKPGRVEVGARGTTSAITLNVQGGRVYYVEVKRLPNGIPNLRQVSFPIGRTEVYRSRLVQQGRGVARPAAPSVPAPAEPAAKTPPPSAPPRRGPDRFALMIKPGSFKINTESQMITLSSPFALQFDSSSSSVFGLEGEWFVRPDISVGGEIVKYSNAYTDSTTPGVGSTDTTAFLVNAKRYFLPGSSWQPYVGAGLGSAVVDFSGTITGNTSGIALQATGGVQWRRDQFALRGEFKYLKADTETDAGVKVDMSGTGIFLGIGIYF